MSTTGLDQPLLIVGKLPKPCYTDLQEFAEDFVKTLRIPLDLISIVKGADGKDGQKGDKGNKGDKGEKGDAGAITTFRTNTVDIPIGATYVEFEKFEGWQTSIYSIGHKGMVGSTDVLIPDYVPATTKTFAVGPILPVYHATLVTKIRCYFVFPAGITQTLDANNILRITVLK